MVTRYTVFCTYIDSFIIKSSDTLYNHLLHYEADTERNYTLSTFLDCPPLCRLIFDFLFKARKS